MRDDGSAAFARPPAELSGRGYVYDQEGMTYRDWLVGGMMREFFVRTVSDADKLAAALTSDQEIREAVLFAHRVADEVMKERFK